MLGVRTRREFEDSVKRAADAISRAGSKMAKAMQLELRPVVSEDIILQAAKNVSTRVGFDERCASDIAKSYQLGDDGFDIALKLARGFNWYLERVDLNWLDQVDAEVKSLLDAAVGAWVIENNIKPKHFVGDRVKWRDIEVSEKVFIVESIHFGKAKYLLRLDGSDSYQTFSVNFEEVEAA